MILLIPKGHDLYSCIRLESEKGLSIFVCMMNVKDVIKNIRLRWVVLAVLLVFIWTTMSSPVMGEWYARTVYPVFSAVLSRFSSLFPFSIGDCFIYGSIAGLIVYLVYAIVNHRTDGGIFALGICLVLYGLGDELFQDELLCPGGSALCSLFGG